MLFPIVLLAAAAAPIQDLQQLDILIAQFTGASVGEEGGAVQPVDKRLRLTACSSSPDFSWHNEKETTLVARCPDAGGWKIYVPVRQDFAAPAAAPANVVAISRGDAVSIAVIGGGFSVSRPGEALEDGAIGEWISVRPATQERRRAEPIRARILKPGVVTLALK